MAYLSLMATTVLRLLRPSLVLSSSGLCWLCCASLCVKESCSALTAFKNASASFLRR
eukprot:CAMPEP_0206514894 /NCGR_PEP_ID=MMETSP0324_2-20121206/62419_1 /ASSEMBLY_ACC=CAM_ASM_000836 /TAXON_ID=2866 /ORGANISM="Crypthecodinium cohnii, Strain Seligo" /LENGTH=56 /DNA_ID=CAMNT_0054007475 /DNA_START=367 /DNA_END=534 /DNA_ORIENTATION=-